MKIENFVILFLSLLIFQCTPKESSSYRIKTKKRVAKRGKCKFDIYYPQLKSLENENILDSINRLLRRLPDYEYNLNICDNGKIKVKNEFDIMMQTDSLLSFEFRTFLDYKNGAVVTVYETLTFNPNSKEIFFDLEKEVLNNDRSLIYPYVKQYNLNKNENVNLLAYEKGSNYYINLGISNKNLIVYLGGEGEGESYDKIEIPLSQLK